MPIMPVETEKWIATQIGARCVRTEMPPMTAWTTTPQNSSQDSRVNTRRLGRCRTVATIAAPTAAVIAVGTLVTGTDPHAGASDASKRLPFKALDITQVHADLVFIVVGLTVALWFALKATDAPEPIVRATRDLFLVLVLQAVIGYTQYFTGLPAWLVLCHMAGACAVWISAWRVFMAMRTRHAITPPDSALVGA